MSSLRKNAEGNEIFEFFGLRFDVDLAERIIQSAPREARVAPRAFLKSFVDAGEDEPDENGVMHIDITKHYVNKEHMKTVDITKPGIVAVAINKADPKRNLGEKPFSILIDGNHRAARALQENKEFKVYVLTPEESWKALEKVTYQGLLKHYVNPTKKPAKPRVKKPPATIVDKVLHEGDKVEYNGQKAIVDDIRGTVIGIKTNDGGYERVNESQLKKIAMKQPGGAPHSANEVARNTNTDLAKLDADWYELKIVFTKEQHPVWAYVPMGMESTPRAVVPITSARRPRRMVYPQKPDVMVPSGQICKDCGEEYKEGYCEQCGDHISTHCDANNSAVPCQDCGQWVGNCCCMTNDPRGNLCNRCFAQKKTGAKQEYTSERTSVNQLPSVFNRVDWEPKTVNLDYGGGKFNQAGDFLKDKGVTNLVFDPYNRAAEHNKDIMHKLKKRKADTATIANVLNVIKEPAIRKQVMRKVKSLVKPGGSVYIMCYRGEGKCPGPTCNGWQENRPIKTYLEEVESVFSSAELSGAMIIARV